MFALLQRTEAERTGGVGLRVARTVQPDLHVLQRKRLTVGVEAEDVPDDSPEVSNLEQRLHDLTALERHGQHRLIDRQASWKRSGVDPELMLAGRYKGKLKSAGQVRTLEILSVQGDRDVRE